MSITTKQTKLEELRAQQAAIAAQVAAAEADLNRAVQARVAEPAPGTKVYITVTFPGSTDEYEYLALRTPNKREHGANWYVTGQKGKLTWDDVLRLVERGTYKVNHLKLLRLQ